LSSQDQIFAGHRALVTGATAGIGRAIAVELARQGAEVVVHGRHPERGRATIDAITAAGGRAMFVAGELTDADDVARVAHETGDVDVLVNNAGVSWFGATPDMDLATYDALFAGNVRAAYLLVAALAPRMAERGMGSIVNISSAGGQVALEAGAAYAATKASLEAFTRCWAAEFGSRGVRVNAVAAGPTYTRPDDRALTEAFGSTTLLGRVAEPEEVAAVVAFIASPRASYVTGTVVASDGGRTVV
jgi:NAD(P)-dependent dehydrogenase (short-subunit alcohol dehydrogenase family)